MALNSNMVPLGTPMPDIMLPDLVGNLVSTRSNVEIGPTLLFWAANHCPYVLHIERELATVLAEFADQPLSVAAISSNDVAEYPDDDFAGLQAQQERASWTFPYLIDTDQAAAKAFDAACTPDFFLYDTEGLLAYRGALDASSPKNNEPLTGDLLREALHHVLAGEPVPEPHRPAMGCGIKWKPGNEPA